MTMVELSTFKYISDYMLIYVKILKLSKYLDILQGDAKMPALHSLYIFLKLNKDLVL